MTEGLINVTFCKNRWVHIDNETDEVFTLEKGTEVTTVAPMEKELTVEELNQLTVEPIGVQMEELDISSDAQPPNLTNDER